MIRHKTEIKFHLLAVLFLILIITVFAPAIYGNFGGGFTWTDYAIFCLLNIASSIANMDNK